MFTVLDALRNAKETEIVVKSVGFVARLGVNPRSCANYSNSSCFSLPFCKSEIMLTIS